MLRREVLQRCYEGEPDALPKHRLLGRVRVRRDHARVGNGLEPVGPWALHERVVERAHGTLFHRTRSARAVGEGVETHVGRDPVEPGPERRAPIESLEASPGTNQGLLDGVIGVHGRAQHPVAVSGQGGAVGLELGDFDRHPSRC